MKNAGIKLVCLFLLSTFITVTAYSQYNWRLSKDKDGIKVYESEINNSNFKSIKVECVLPGTYDKLMAILSDVSRHKDWVFLCNELKVGFFLWKQGESRIHNKCLGICSRRTRIVE